MYEDDTERYAKEKREAHSLSEQKRRQAINAAIEDLRSKVGANQFDSKATVLQHAIRRFETLEDECIQLRMGNDRLQRENTVLRSKAGERQGSIENHETWHHHSPSSSITLPPPIYNNTGARRGSLPHLSELSISAPRGFTSDLPAPISPRLMTQSPLSSLNGYAFPSRPQGTRSFSYGSNFSSPVDRIEETRPGSRLGHGDQRW